MGKVLRIFKINILALAATVLFVLAIAANLLAKSLEKIFLIIGILVGVLGIISILFESVESTDGIMSLVILIVFGGVFVALLIWILTALASACVVLIHFLISMLEILYDATFNGYTYLYDICKADYAKVCIGSNKNVMAVFCIFFKLLAFINRIVVFAVSQALKLSVVISVVLVGITLISAEQTALKIYGVHYWQYMGMFPLYDIIYGIVLYLVVIGGIVAVIISLGIEWSEWGEELDITTADYKEYSHFFSERDNFTRISADKAGDNIDIEKLEKFEKYYEIVINHVTESDEFFKKIQPVVAESNDMLLREHYNEYSDMLLAVAKKVLSYEGKIPVEEFLGLIPKIKDLESLKKDIEKRAQRSMETRRKVEENLFFSGCDTKEKLEKRYKLLCKTYHPDVDSGDEETFKRMQVEYERKKAEF